MTKNTKKKATTTGKKTSSQKSKKSAKQAPPMRRYVFSDIVGISLIGLGLLMLASLFSDKVGLIGEGIRLLSVGTLGFGGYIMPVYMTYVGILYMKDDEAHLISSLKHIIPLVLVIMVFFHLLCYGEQTNISLLSLHYFDVAAVYNGGWLGAAAAYMLLKVLGLWGSYILLGVGLGIWLLVVTQFPLFSWIQEQCATGLGQFRDYVQESYKHRNQMPKAPKRPKKERPVKTPSTDFYKEEEEEHPPIFINHGEQDTHDFAGAIEDVQMIEDLAPIAPLQSPGFREQKALESQGVEEVAEPREAFVKPQPHHATTQSEQGEGLAATLDEEMASAGSEVETPYVFPSLELLAKGEGNPTQRASSRQSLANAKKLEDTLRSFGVEAKVTQINKGPTVTRYELQPKQGVKVSKIVNLADDIALNLAAAGIRIEAPIPGKAAVGIEVPNEQSEMVYLREVIASDTFAAFPSRLAFALGKDIAGKPIVTDIAKMPHMLIAGATGS